MFLEIKGISKGFGKLEVVKNVSFSLEKGEVLAIIGPSGSGKSTLLRCLNFLEKADRGSVTLGEETLISVDAEGKSVYGKDEESRKKALHFGLVFQQFNLFPHLSVLQNLTLAPTLVDGLGKAEAETLARGLLERVGLSEKADSYPYQLSGGQQQRVAIARALAMRPDTLCFDEPTSALDPELTGEVLKVIRGLKSTDSTMIVVTHEMNFARSVADKVLFLDNGEIAEYGTPEQVFDRPENERTREFIHKLNEKV